MRIVQLVAVVMASFLACANAYSSETFTITSQPVEALRVLDGSVEAVNQATLSAQTSGRIVELMFDVDDFVPAGSVIARFRDTEQKAALDQATANLSAAQAQANDAKVNFERIKGLFSQPEPAVSKRELDSADAALKSAEANVRAAQAAEKRAREQLEYTRVRAPYSGIVTERFAEVGETVNPGTPIMSGVSLERMRVNVQVPQSMIMALRNYNEGYVVMNNGETHIPVEKLTFFPYADSATSSFKVRADLAEDTEGLFPGMYVKMAFKIGEQNRLLVPESAVVYRSEVTGVYVQRENGWHLRHVRLGDKRDGNYIVLAGLMEGDVVSLNPSRALLEIKQGISSDVEETTEETVEEAKESSDE